MARIKIENGKILSGDVQVGTANKDFKHGYHPAILVEVADQRVWFELDEPDLLAKRADFARENAR